MNPRSSASLTPASQKPLFAVHDCSYRDNWAVCSQQETEGFSALSSASTFSSLLKALFYFVGAGLEYHITSSIPIIMHRVSPMSGSPTSQSGATLRGCRYYLDTCHLRSPMSVSMELAETGSKLVMGVCVCTLKICKTR